MKSPVMISLILFIGISMGYFTNEILHTGTELPSQFSEIIPAVLAQTPTQKESPADRIKMEQILVFDDKVVLNVKEAQWSQFTDTHSMEPLISSTANAIQLVPKSPGEIKLGDIISYESEFAEGIFIHRVIEIGKDQQGWYATVKGDNNPSTDPGKIRFSQIKRVVVAIIY
ncbi:MAG: hypothetical protein AABX51_08555 [Nanoarchaeota archaeon]